MKEVAARSSVSSSHLGRMERGERSPSFAVLRKIARPLGFEETELLRLADYLSPQPPGQAESQTEYDAERLDPYVAMILSQESVEVQRTVISILSILKSIARGNTSRALRATDVSGLEAKC